MNIPHLVKAQGKDCVCDKCGGFASVDAEVVVKLPLGFGFREGKGFVVDMVQYKGWRGQCMDCEAEAVFWTSRRNITKKPRSINRKLAMAGA